MTEGANTAPARRRIVFVNRRAPHGSIYAHEALESVLMAAAFEQDVTVLFLDDGVYQLKRGQDTAASGMKNFAPAFRALPDLDVERIVVERESLARRGLAAADLVLEVEVRGEREVAALLDGADVVLTC